MAQQWACCGHGPLSTLQTVPLPNHNRPQPCRCLPTQGLQRHHHAAPPPARPTTTTRATAKQEPSQPPPRKPQAGPSKPASRPPPKRSPAPKESAGTGERDPDAAPRAPRAQRQLFGALEALRTGGTATPPPTTSGAGFGKGKPQAKSNKGPRTPASWGPSKVKDDGPEDVLILAAPPSLGLEAKPVQAPAAKATSSSSSSSSSSPAGQGVGVDEVDGSQVWREKLEAVGWSYDEDEEGEEGEEEGEDEWEDDYADNEEELDDLLEVTPFGTWFAGEGTAPEETADQQTLRRWYTDQNGFLPPPQWGPIKATNVPGKGRGLVATKVLAPGDLVMVSSALSLLTYEPDEDKEAEGPENEELADHMMNTAKLTATQMTWLQDLMLSTRPDAPQPDSSSDSSQATTASRRPVTLRLPTQEEVQALQSKAGPLTPLASSKVLSKEQLYTLVNLNCLGEEFKELASSSLREEDAPGWLGLWADAALINHSCTPNATYWVLGDRLVVRATEEVPSGQEVTLSYLGALLTSPLTQRRAELKDKWGFHCTCQRCKAEEKAAPPGSALAVQVQEIYEWCQELSEVLNKALEDEDYPEVEDIRRELITRRDEFEAAMRAAKLTSKARRWVQASVYDLYDMLSLCADEEGPATPSPQGGNKQQQQQAPAAGGAGAPAAKRGGSGTKEGVLDTESLAVCARVLDAVGRGSDAQAYLAAEYMVRAGVRFGAQHHEALEAQKMCRVAFTARFGAVSPSLMDQLITARLDD